MNNNVERIVIGKDHTKDIQAYIDYHNIVGDDDGGKMMSEEEFEAYKKKVAQARKNHLYVYWINSNGFECKAIGPESMCFCGHRYKGHNFDNVKTKKVNCKTAKCKCPVFSYVPVYGSNDVKCLCKHSFRDHDASSRKCCKPACKCSMFGSKFTCNCTCAFDDHETIIQTREERIADGKAVDPGWMGNNMIAGAGGLNSFQGMVNDVYQLEYKALLDNPDKKPMLMGDFEKKAIGDSEEASSYLKGTSGKVGATTTSKIKPTVTAFELFIKPHKYANMTKSSVTGIAKKMGALSLGRK